MSDRMLGFVKYFCVRTEHFGTNAILKYSTNVQTFGAINTFIRTPGASLWLNLHPTFEGSSVHRYVCSFLLTLFRHFTILLGSNKTV